MTTTKAKGEAQYINALVKAIKTAIEREAFPKNERGAECWSILGPKIAPFLSHVMTEEDYIKACGMEKGSMFYDRFHWKPDRALSALTGQRSQSFEEVNRQFESGEYEFVIISDPSFGFYAGKLDDKNIDRMVLNREKVRDGFIRSSENIKRIVARRI
jgi:hypothetical protein